MQQNVGGQGARPKDRGQRKGKGQGHAKEQQKQKPKVFEPYWPVDAVRDGIKRGQLIVGRIRINPKNYEDAYVPSPDGKADLYIGGMADRNRALNSDEVVVLPYPFQQWRVSVEDFQAYERSLSGGCDDDERDDDQDKNADSDDSGPDVIMDNSDDDDDDDNGTAAAASAVNGDVGSSDQCKTGPTEKVNAAMKEMAISSDSPATLTMPAKGEATPTYSPGPGGRTSLQNERPALPKVKRSPPNVSKQTPSTPQRKFASVSDMMKNSSPVARNLFGVEGQAAMKDVKGFQFLQQTGRVVYISEKKHSRAAGGHIKLMPDKNKNLALFAPSDSRIPRIVIPMADCPEGFYERPGDFVNTLFIARIEQWDETSKMPKGKLMRSLGEAGQVEPQTEAMLIEMDVDDSPFSEEVLQCLPQDLPWSIPESELACRKDLRQSCIFTIDPATARDLDDAVSIEKLGNGLYEVGVHIADVSYFVQEGTKLDECAAKRATSVYLVQKVVPMLPRLLCEELCSLNPDQDKLTFSVIWTINQHGEIHDEWYGRTVIRSCVKLSYDHAQGFIDQPEKEWTQDELPPITNSFGVKDVMKRVLLLNELAIQLRKQRFDNGALRLDQVKLQYTLNPNTGLPSGYSVYQQRDSNRLIEEFMLLANMAVAHKIKTSFPDKAILRRHPPPQDKPMEKVEEMCETMGLNIDAGTAGALQRSLWQYHKEDEYSQARLQVLVVLVSKPMQPARYFCAGTLADEVLYHHYALNVPLYTHFTSPIRRYPDIMVHRLLAAALGYCDPTEKSPQLLHKQADYCNDKKWNAKTASDRSSDMFFSVFVKEAGPLEENGMVMAILDKAFDVLILKLGVIKRVYMEQLPLMSFKFRKNMKCPELEIVWAADEKCDHQTRHVISLFTMVECVVYADKEPLRCSCTIKRPQKEIQYVQEADQDSQ